MKKIILIVALSGVGCLYSQVTTVSIPLSQGTGQDSYLPSGAPDTNYGSHPSLGGNTWTCGGELCLSRGLFKFDLSGLPPVISSASLVLVADVNWGAGPTTGPGNSGYLRRVTAAWTENSVTWNTQPPVTTLNEVIIPASISNAQNYNLNVTALVQDMLNTGNYGFMLIMADEVEFYKSLMFASSDNMIPSNMPVLNIKYDITGVADHIKGSRVTVFPDPSENGFTFQSEKEIERIEIVDGLGQLALSTAINSKNLTIGEGLLPGVYSVNVYFGDGTISGKKIVKL